MEAQSQKAWVEGDLLVAGLRYVLRNGLVTEPMRVGEKNGAPRAKACLRGHHPKQERQWDGRGKNLLRHVAWDVVEVFDASKFPTELKEGHRYYYVSGGMTGPLTYLPKNDTYCLFDVGHQWNKLGKNLDYEGEPFAEADLVVETPLFIGVGIYPGRSL